LLLLLTVYFLADRTYVTVELMVRLSFVCHPSSSSSVTYVLWLNGEIGPRKWRIGFQMT